MIYVGLDDTDTLQSPGTNQVARALASHLAGGYDCELIVRHQLLVDPRVPYTRKNSAAAMLLRPQDDSGMEPLIEQLRALLRERFVEGSDPGLCVAGAVAAPIREFGKRCQRELVTQGEARRLARRCGVHLEGLGGTEDGVIGALAAVGLVAAGDDGRVVQIGAWPDDLAGPQDVESLQARNVEVCCSATGEPVRTGTVDVGKHLRPNYRQKRVVLFARPAEGESGGSSCRHAVRLP